MSTKKLNIGYLGVKPRTAIVCTSDRTKLAALEATASWYITVSTNGGYTWTPNHTFACNLLQYGIACTPDGSKLAVIGVDGDIRVSYNWGTSWATKEGPRHPYTGYSSIVYTSTGSRLYLCGDATIDFLYYSDNDGDSWTRTSAYVLDFKKILVNSAGTAIYGNSGNTGFYKSFNSGSTWETASIYSGYYISSIDIASSADMSRAIFLLKGDPLHGNNNYVIQISDNYGATGSWTIKLENTDVKIGLCCSADASVIVYRGVTAGGQNYLGISSDYGATWTNKNITMVLDSIAITPDGKKIFGVLPKDYKYGVAYANNFLMGNFYYSSVVLDLTANWNLVENVWSLVNGTWLPVEKFKIALSNEWKDPAY